MKREQLILQSLSDTQLNHAQKILNKEVQRRHSDSPPAPRRGGAHRSGQHKAVGKKA